MNFWMVALISLIAGTLLLCGAAFLVYMGSLVKTAYQLKVEMRGEIDSGLKRLQDETEKTLKRLRRELGEEIERNRGALMADQQQRMKALSDSVASRLQVIESTILADRANTLSSLETLRRDVEAARPRRRPSPLPAEGYSRGLAQGIAATPGDEKAETAAAVEKPAPSGADPENEPEA